MATPDSPRAQEPSRLPSRSGRSVDRAKTRADPPLVAPSPGVERGRSANSLPINGQPQVGSARCARALLEDEVRTGIRLEPRRSCVTSRRHGGGTALQAGQVSGDLFAW